MMTPIVSRAELNASDDIIAEIGIVKSKRRLSGAAVGSPAAACEGKKAFDGKATADISARRRSGRVAYRCRFCRKWHVGGNLDK